MAAFPPFLEAVERLRGWGVTVLFGPDVVRLHPPGMGDAGLHEIPWHLLLEPLKPPLAPT
jgi:hypothetical protein